MNYNKQIICNNCGKFGHTHKQCSEPITSLGIICLKVSPEIKDKLITYKIARKQQEYSEKKLIIKKY